MRDLQLANGRREDRDGREFEVRTGESATGFHVSRGPWVRPEVKVELTECFEIWYLHQKKGRLIDDSVNEGSDRLTLCAKPLAIEDTLFCAIWMLRNLGAEMIRFGCTPGQHMRQPG